MSHINQWWKDTGGKILIAMKNVLLSADSEISVFSVPDKVADNLEIYCLEFCDNWLRKSPNAAKYRVKMNGMTVYLNQYVCDEPSKLITTITGVYDKDELPPKYTSLPYFNF